MPGLHECSFLRIKQGSIDLAKQGTGKPTCSLENQPGKSGGGSLIIILLVIGIICAIGGFGIYWYIQHKKQKEDGLSLYHGDRTDSLHN